MPVQLLLSWPAPVVIPAVVSRALEGPAVRLEVLCEIAEPGILFAARFADEKTMRVFLGQVGRGVRARGRGVCPMIRYADAPLSPGIGRVRMVHIAKAKLY